MASPNFVFVDVEAPLGVGAPSVGDASEFGAVLYVPGEPYASWPYFHGTDCSRETFVAFAVWLTEHVRGQPVMWSDNPAYDWQWVNFYFWKHLGRNPFGHSARRISDFYAGLCGNVHRTQEWKRLRITPHTHHPVFDAQGNAEAFDRILKGER